jgi:Kef-type K+ transport system membrane component KefB/Trk K+ transport system NAD-binding subunit
MTESSTFFEITAILSLAALLGIIGQRLRQPLIIMFLATGILAGPSGFGIIRSYSQIELLAHIGIALLLFIVGLKLDLNLIRSTGPVAVVAGLGQIIFTALLGFLIALAIGMSNVSAIYIAAALTFSSTIIIVKILSDKKEIDSLHGQIAIGILIVQDIAAILAMVALTTFGAKADENGSVLSVALLIALKAIGFLGAVALLMKYVLPGLTKRLAKSQEMLTLFAIAWAVFLGAAGVLLGLNKEVGAFLAGVSLASTGYRDSISARLTSLRDFLLLFFFIDLGARLNLSAIGSDVWIAVLFSLFVLIGKPVITIAIMGAMGYRRRTGAMTGISIAQISEFSLILAALGLSLGHITPQAMGIITLVGVATIFASSYMIMFSGQIYKFISGFLKIFERRNPYREAAGDSLKKMPSVDVILLGLGSYGSGIAEYLLQRNKTMIGVDFDPLLLEKWRSRGVPVLYGDMADPEIHERLPLNKSRWIVSSVRSKELNMTLINLLRRRGHSGKVALTAINQEEADLFEKHGAQIVFRPFRDAAEQAVDSLAHAMDVLPEQIDWPIAFREVRIRTGAAFAGKTVRNIPLRSLTGVSILAVSRAGKVHFDPEPDFQIYPGDRLVVMGHPEDLRHAETLLNQHNVSEDADVMDRFEIGEIVVGDNSNRSGRTLKELEFRQKHNVTVVGIRRGGKQITALNPDQVLHSRDHLIVIGITKAVEKLKENEPL